MKYKWKFISLTVLVILLALSVDYFPDHTDTYSRFVFYPFQSVRSLAFDLIPFSLGDVLYVLSGLWLLVTIIKLVRNLIHFRQYKEQVGGNVLSIINVLIAVYLLFLLGWGFNYNKPPLRIYWSLAEAPPANPAPDTATIKQRRMKDSLTLIAFNGFLVDKLNTYAPHYHALPFRDVNERAKKYYHTCTDSKVKQNGLWIKHTLFGYFMKRMAVDGYYNPFTGEGQADADLPGFQLPFIICHEMAHQAGIAAEGDANLMAYALGTIANDTSFNYSCYLNIWIYTNNRLYRRDSTVAKTFIDKLNKLTTAHLDTLEEISRQYDHTMTRYSNTIYDSYLKLQDQKEGIKSYGNVVTSAWQLEQKRKNTPQGIIHIP